MPLDKKNSSTVAADVKITFQERADGAVIGAHTIREAKINIDFELKDSLPLKEIQEKLKTSIDTAYDDYIKREDKNGDGKVTHSDFRPELQGNIELLTREDFEKLANAAIHKLSLKDTNKDGNLSKKEFIPPKDLPKPEPENQIT